MGACVRKVTLMNAWYLLYCNNNDLDRIAYRCKTMNVVAFCPRYIKFTPRKDCNAVRKEEKVLFPNYLFLHFDVNVTHTSAITSIQCNWLRKFRFHNMYCTGKSRYRY